MITPMANVETATVPSTLNENTRLSHTPSLDSQEVQGDAAQEGRLTSEFEPYAEMMKRIQDTVNKTLGKNKKRIPISKSNQASYTGDDSDDEDTGDFVFQDLTRQSFTPQIRLESRMRKPLRGPGPWRAHGRKVSHPSSMTESEGDEDDLGWEFEEDHSNVDENEQVHAFREDPSFLEYDERNLDRPSSS